MGPDSELVAALKGIADEVFILALPIILLFFVRSLIEEIIAGMIWRWRSGYERNEIVSINGDWARITDLGWMRTYFVVYIWEGETVIGGYSMNILNSELRKMKIKQQLEMVNSTGLKKASQTI